MIERVGKKIVRIQRQGKDILNISNRGRLVYTQGDTTPQMVLVGKSSERKTLDLSYNLLRHIREENVDAELDWGDGSEPVQLVRNRDMESTPLIHNYESAGEYRVTIKGRIGWDGLTENERYSSRSICEWLRRIELPNGISPIRWKNARAFYGCHFLEKLTPGLYNHIPNATDFSYDFTDCPIGEIPKNFLKYCYRAYNFTKTFAYTLLTAIDEDIFNNLQPYYLDSCFEGNSGITGKLPEFWNTLKHDTSHKRCFGDCRNASNYADAVAAGWV